MESPKKQLVPALAKADRIISFIAQNKEISFTRIHEELELPKSSVYSLLTTLEHFGFVRLSPSGKYSLGLRLFELGTLAASSIDLRTEARPIIKDLANRVQLTGHLGIMHGIEGRYLIKEEVESILKITSWEGKQIRLLSSAIGKALLAWQPPDIIEEVIENSPLVPYTRNTIIDPVQIREELAKTKERGWAIDDEEDGYEIRCVASSVRGLHGEMVASISVCGTLRQMSMKRMELAKEEILQSCDLLSKKLGYQK